MDRSDRRPDRDNERSRSGPRSRPGERRYSQDESRSRSGEPRYRQDENRAGRGDTRSRTGESRYRQGDSRSRSGESRYRQGDSPARGERARPAQRPTAERGPAIPEGIEASDLDRQTRSRLRGLTKDNAERVAKHLVAAGLLLDDDPEGAYRHAQAAVDRAGRIDVVREAAAIAAYRTSRFDVALREARTVRRMNGSWHLAALEADCERGLGRPERAISFAKEALAQDLDVADRVELAIVVAGARDDLGDKAAALAELDRLLGAIDGAKAPVLVARLTAARSLLAGEEVSPELLDLADPIEVSYAEVDIVDTLEDDSEEAEDADGAEDAVDADDAKDVEESDGSSEPPPARPR